MRSSCCCCCEQVKREDGSGIGDEEWEASLSRCGVIRHALETRHALFCPAAALQRRPPHSSGTS